LVRVIAKRALRDFWRIPKYADAEQPLKAWYRETRKVEWKTSQAIKAQYRSASFLRHNRVVFNIAGNKYRLVVKLNYAFGIVYIRFVGTHKQYDAIDPETI
jgi:mRNA interferase HigB